MTVISDVRCRERCVKYTTLSPHIALSVPACEHSYQPVTEYCRIMFTKDGVVPFVAGCEMLDVTVRPQEVRSSSRTSQAKDRETCPICKKRAGGVDWQQCTKVRCGQWVHCRCEAEQNKTYKCPGCRKS